MGCKIDRMLRVYRE